MAQPLPWALCRDPQPDRELLAPLPAAEDDDVHLSADVAEVLKKERFILRGNAEARYLEQWLTADAMLYDKPSERVEAQGDIRFRRDGLLITGRSAYYELVNRRGQIDGVEYLFTPRHARGVAETAAIEGPDRARFADASYTTCDPGDNDWYLRAKDIRLDRAEGTGTARHAWLTFKGVPLLYAPYLSFPIDERRRSGFLAPSAGTSDSSGIEFALPYYWNIAPNRDATFTPRLLSKRGILLRGEYRYLNPTNLGELNVEYLPYDRVYDDDRGLIGYRHQGRLTERWHSDIDFNYVSDRDYFSDLGNSLNVASLAFLEQRGDLVYYGPYWSLLGRLQAFQTLDESVAPSDRPYQRLPQLLFNADLPEGPYGLGYQFAGELVRFDRDTGVVGERLDVQPALRLPFTRPGGYLLGTAKVRHTQYRLDNAEPDMPESPTRTLPILSVDGRLFFEREVMFRNNRLLQTLEPRLYYLYIPFEDQSDLPVFDTVERELSFAQLFQDNRFIGADRVGDANQLTLALTTRLVDRQSGVERLRASIGQIRYFRDLLVTLPDEPVETNPGSDILGELSATIAPTWYARTTAQWDSDEQRTDRSTIYLRYQPAEGRVVNVGYRVVDPDVEQTDMSVLWPVSSNWSVLGRWNYSLADDRTVESVLGFEYESCCWAFRLAARRFVTDEGGDANNSLFMQLELKGLTRVGRQVEELLERDFLGY